MDSVGIDKVSFYIPENRISIEDIIQNRKRVSQEMNEILIKAQATTEQAYIRYTHDWQDSVCIAAQSVLSLLDDEHIDISQIRSFISATETPVDLAKPNSAFLLGILKQADIMLPRNLVNYQVQHACAGGTAALIQTAALIGQRKKDSTGIVSMADIAHYTTPSSAEITQGAGSVAMYLSRNPRLLTFDTQHIGYSSEDVDDFFRPLNSPTAKVRGGYSMQCYIDAVYQAMSDYMNEKNQSIDECIEDNDYFVFHTPFATMPEMAFSAMLKKKFSKTPEEIHTIIANKRINMSSSVVCDIGNTYTAATYFPLGYLLQNEYKTLQQDFIGKKILLLSYGAGNTALVLQTTVAKNASVIIEQMNLTEQLQRYHDKDFDAYVKWCDTPESKNTLHPQHTHTPSVFLKNIRSDDQYREYGLS